MNNIKSVILTIGILTLALALLSCGGGGGGGDKPLSAPSGLQAAAGDQMVTLTWTANTENDLAGYFIYQGPAADPLQLSRVNVDPLPVSAAPSFIITGLVNDTTYYFAVTAFDLSGEESVLSGIVSAVPTVPVQGPPTPANLRAVPGDRSVNLVWDIVTAPDLKEYVIYSGLSEDGAYALIDRTTFNFHTVTGLKNGTEYFYRVSAVDNDDIESTLSDAASAVPFDIVPPPAPTGLVISSGDETLELSWSPVQASDMKEYFIYSSLTAGGPYTKTNTIPSVFAFFIHTSLDNGTKYYYVITAVDTSGNESGRSEEISGTPRDNVPPAAPTGFKTQAGDAFVLLSWDKNNDADFKEYRLYRSRNADGPFSRVVSQVQLNYSDFSVTNDLTYYYYVVAADFSDNESEPTTVLEATPRKNDITPPPIPTGLTAVPGENNVLLNWDESTVPDFYEFIIYSYIDGTEPQVFVELARTADNTYDHTNVISGTTYHYKVAAADTSGNISIPSLEVSATPIDETAPSVPVGLTATPADMRITLDWEDNPEGDVIEYVIYSSDTEDGTYTELDRSDISEYIHSGLDNGVEYFYRVSALDGTGNESDQTAMVSAVPRDQEAPPVVENLNGTAADRSVQLTWDNVPAGDLAEYIIYRSQVSGSGYTEVGRSAVNSFLDTSVANSITYFYIVTALDTSGNEGDASGEGSFTPSN